MARWVNENTRFLNVNLMWMKPTSDRADFKFQISRWRWENKEIIEEKASYIEWKLKKIELAGYDYNDERWAKRHIKTITFILEDDGEELRYGGWYNMVSRQIIYCLSSIEEFWKIKLSPYISQKGNKNIWVENDWKPVSMKFDFEKDIKSKCSYSEEFQKFSYTKLDEWIDNELVPAINEKIQKQEEEYSELPF